MNIKFSKKKRYQLRASLVREYGSLCPISIHLQDILDEVDGEEIVVFNGRKAIFHNGKVYEVIPEWCEEIKDGVA